MMGFFFLCLLLTVPSGFSNMSYSVKEDHAVLNWEHSGAEKNVYVEYVLQNSKIFFHGLDFLSVK